MLTRLECDQMQGGVSVMRAGLDSIASTAMDRQASPILLAEIGITQDQLRKLFNRLEEERRKRSFEAVAPEEAEQP